LNYLSKKINKYFAYFYLLSISNIIESDSNGITVKGINRDYVRSIKIPLPAIEIQNQIVSRIEKEQELLNANKQLIKLFEQKIKDRIAKVWGKNMKKIEEIIEEVINRSKSEKRKHIEDEWFKYLKENLEFPFISEVNLASYSEVLSDGDIVKVKDLDDMIDMYGMIMKIKKERKTYYIPLVELDLIDKESKNYRIIEAFLEWGANYE
jgi:restriction endonuclease S subunit